jgi:tetratricopeptide (TPR) repeat protein
MLLVRAVELAPTLERRYFAARAAWRLGDMTAVIVEMEEVASTAEREGERRLQGRALTALAEAVLNQRADAMAARALAERAVDVLADDEPDVRFEAFRAAVGVASWLNDDEAFERWAKLALEAARLGERRDQEIQITMALAENYVDRIAELAEEIGSIVGRALAALARGMLENWRGNEVEAEAAYVTARDLYREIGNTQFEAYATLMIGRQAAALGELERAEKQLLDAVRMLKGIGDRARLCEAQRSLAEVYVALGRIDEAERYALEARESVGPEDKVSLSTTKLSLGLVRAAQGRDEEAERLMRDAAEALAMLGLRAPERWALAQLVEFYRARGREDDAVRCEDRVGELTSSSTSRIA